MDWTQADLEAMYQVRTSFDVNNPDAYVSYGLAMAQYSTRMPYQSYRDTITTIFNRNLYSAGDTVLVVGCGYGYLMSMMLEAGANQSRVWGTDISSYIQTNKALQVNPAYPLLAANILNIDIMLANAQDLLKAAIGGNGKVDWVICENVTETIAPALLGAWLNACNNLLSANGNVLHIVTVQDHIRLPDPDPLWGTYGWTWQTLEQWQADALQQGYSAHYWMAINEYEVINNIRIRRVLGGA